MIKYGTFKRQDINLSLDIMAIANDTEACLAGSAEQGILERFSEQEVKPKLIYAKNQCFRNESEYEDLLRVREFIKVEQFCFTTKDCWEDRFELLMNSAISFLMKLGVEYRVVDVTSDPGYHIKKSDIQVKTKSYGWIETHSCSYFGEEQSKRFGITGATHTLSNTGIATPRILIPFIEGLARIE